MSVKALLGFCLLCLFCPSGNSAQAKGYHFASIQSLHEQEVGRIVLPEIYRKLRLAIEISPLPALRAQHKASHGLVDGEIMRIWSYGEENPSLIRVPTPYYALTTMPFVLRSSDIQVASKDDLKPYFLQGNRMNIF